MINNKINANHYATLVNSTTDAEKNIAVNMKRIKSLARTQDQKLIFNNKLITANVEY